MSVASINRETALRIALAARVLPGVDVGQLLEMLSRKLKTDLNESGLTKITVADFKKSFEKNEGEEDGEEVRITVEEMKEAVRILWGETALNALPTIEPLTNSLDRSIRVAVASNSGEKLDGHFGSCIRYLIYQLSEEKIQLIDIRSAVDAAVSAEKNAFRADLISDCELLFVVSIGGPAAARVVRVGTHPIKKPKGGEAREILTELQGVMKNSPPPWLAKLFGDDAEQRVRFEREEIAS